MKKGLSITIALLFLLIFPLAISSSQYRISNKYVTYPSTKTLKVMTFNIRGGRTANGSIHLHQIIEEIRQMDPDIIALQEVDFRLPRSHFQNQAQQIGEALKMNYVFIPSINFIVGSYGNALLSKFPFHDYDFVKLPSGLETRGFLKAKVQVGKTAVEVYATHLGLDPKVRRKQVSTLTTAMSFSNLPKILLGDFNMKPNEILISNLRTAYIDPVYKNNLKISTYQGKSKPFQLDYIFYTKPFLFQHALSDPSMVSDHNPLLYALSIPNGFFENSSSAVSIRSHLHFPPQSKDSMASSSPKSFQLVSSQ